MNNIKKIDLNLLVVLDALLDERNVTREPRGWATRSRRLVAC
jgi:hypothetical protein